MNYKQCSNCSNEFPTSFLYNGECTKCRYSKKEIQKQIQVNRKNRNTLELVEQQIKKLKKEEAIRLKKELIELREYLKGRKKYTDNSWLGRERWSNYNHATKFRCCECKDFLPPCRFIRLGEYGKISPARGKEEWIAGGICDECLADSDNARKFYVEVHKAEQRLRAEGLPLSAIRENAGIIDEKIFQTRFRNQFKTIKIKL